MFDGAAGLAPAARLLELAGEVLVGLDAEVAGGVGAEAVLQARERAACGGWRARSEEKGSAKKGNIEEDYCGKEEADRCCGQKSGSSRSGFFPPADERTPSCHAEKQLAAEGRTEPEQKTDEEGEAKKARQQQRTRRSPARSRRGPCPAGRPC